jgi:hypothetical protein
MSSGAGVPLYDGKPLEYSKNPVGLKKSDAEYIESMLTAVLKDVEDFTNRALKDKKLLREVNVPDDLDPTPTPLGLHIPFARFDFLFDGKKIYGLELNTDGTSGFNVVEWLGAQSGLSPEENPNYNLSARLLSALREHKPDATEIALVDLPGIITSWEQHDLVKKWQKSFPKSYYSEPGVRSWGTDALCYRRILSWQMRANRELCKPFLEDWKEQKITVVGGWSSDVGMSKAWPAILKPNCFPETVLFNEKSAKRIIDEKDNWVIKGALSYSGNAIFRGIDLTQNRWQICVMQALQETLLGRHWIGQRRIDVPLIDGKPFELGLYFLNGKPSGYMCRWGSHDAISETSNEIFRAIKITS